MSTATVSASVDAKTKVIANAYIRQAGQTPNEVIRGLWENIAETGKVPQFQESVSRREDERREAFTKAQRIIRAVPHGTALASMSDADLRKELESREISTSA